MGRSKTFANIKVFSRKKMRKYTHSTSILLKKNQREIVKNSINEENDSFRRNSQDHGLVSTQQLPVDNSQFVNNTFFGSAEVKVNVAFDKIINNYPFDGTYQEVEKFEDSLSSLEKHVLESFPKNKAFVRFTGDQYIETKDSSGYLSKNLSKGSLGLSPINPMDKSFSVELHFMLPKEANNNSYIMYCLKDYGLGNFVGFSGFVKENDSTSTAEVGFLISSGSQNIVLSSSFSKGDWHNVHFICDKRENKKNILIAEVDENQKYKVIKESPYSNIGALNTDSSTLFVGKGQELNLPNFSFTPGENYTGYIDEFRLFHNIRVTSEIEYYSKKNIFSHDNLRLCFRFNEPAQSYNNNDIVLDHSGNSLHSRIENFNISTVKSNFEAGVTNPMLLENPENSPILFPQHPEVLTLNNSLLNEASEFDANNPNMITKLVPQHYLNEGSQFEGVAVDGELVESYDSTSNLPRSGKMGSAQLISLLLYFFAEEFDSYKMYLDQASELLNSDYLDKEGVSSTFLSELADYHGFDLPDIFSDASYEQYLGKESLGMELGVYEKSISDIQNLVWRRILKNLNHILKSKGTKESIKQIFRSSGIEPDRLFRMVEFGGKKEFRLGKSRQKIIEMSTMLDFSGSNTYKSTETTLPNGMLKDRPYLISAHLTGSRIEPGVPSISGGNVLASGSLKFHSTDLSQVPADGNTVTLKDSFGNTKVFEFDTNSSTTGQNIPVNITNLSTTGSMDVLIATITGSLPNSFSISKSRSQPGHNIDTINIETKNFSRYDLGNHSISTTANSSKLSVDGFANGNGFVQAGNPGFEETGISATPSDGLLTSGSWSVEGIYQFGDNLEKEVKRSLSRLVLSGTQNGNPWENKKAVASNLVLSDVGDSLTLYVRSSYPDSSDLIQLTLTGSKINLLNGQKWYVCYGRERNDRIGQPLSSSYFIRAASFEYDKITSFYEKKRSFYEGDPNKNVFQTSTPAAGTTWTPPFLLIGSQSIENGAQGQFLNDTTEGSWPLDIRASYFDGKVGHVKFWSKAIDKEESLEHTRNFKSIGVNNPKINNTFARTTSGSFEKLRLNLSTDQIDKSCNANGSLGLTDFSQNYVENNSNKSGLFLALSGGMCHQFSPFKKIVKDERFDYSIISPFYDENLDDGKIDIAGFTEGENIELYNSKTAPVHEIDPWDKEINDNRFEIQLHLQRGLDEDIMNIFSSIEALDNALGRPELVFAEEYPDLKRLRNLYFNRLTEKVNYRNFFDLFRWLDDAFADTVSKMVPRNSEFLGINLIIESHALERCKIAYKHHDIYNAPDDRANLRSVLLVSQRSGIIRRF